MGTVTLMKVSIARFFFQNCRLGVQNTTIDIDLIQKFHVILMVVIVISDKARIFVSLKPYHTMFVVNKTIN